MTRILDIAFKDLTRSFRSMFAMGMMVIAPLMLTGLIYFAFGGMSGGDVSMNAIRVGVVNPRLSALGDGRVRATFRQEYESDSFSDTVTKVLELRNENGWKVVREYTR